MKTNPYHLFEGIGIELEYMIVDKETLDVLPVCDEIIYAETGTYESEIEQGSLNWSNELVLHVIELKTNGPARNLESLPFLFQKDVDRINHILEPMSGMLLPTAMHPWMHPDTETRLWPHEHSPVYEAYNTIFGCQGHGWSNLQSTHINLPFNGDDEFGALHAAIRLILPLLPGLAASSPIMDGYITGVMDSRLEAYRKNQALIPSLSGNVIPEPIYSQKKYETKLLKSLYRAIAPFDPKGILQHEWLNSRGAIARFDRQAIEIRVLDIAECPLMDLTIAAAIETLLKCLIEETWASTKKQQAYSQENLVQFYDQSAIHAEQTLLTDKTYLAHFGYQASKATISELWQCLFETNLKSRLDKKWHTPMKILLNHGPLARRIQQQLGTKPSKENIHQCYHDLSQCLASGVPFLE